MHILHMEHQSKINVHPDNIQLMEAELSRRGISISALCRKAEVASTTWGRWKRGEVSPTFKTWGSVAAAYDQLIASKSPDRAAS